MTYKIIIWICDKSKCRHVNRREIQRYQIINDDICDGCHKAVHEPIVEEITKTKKEK